jgi:KaiC/GvpD/RAD55 family RecA-like ATPase
MMTYDLTATIPVDALESVPTGTAFLVSCLDNDVSERFVVDLLAAGGAAGEGALAITTEKAGTAIEQSYRRRAGASASGELVVVDCQAGERRVRPGTATIQKIATPRDLTDVGMCMTNAGRRFESLGIDRVRVGVLSLTELFAYASRETVFKFCNTATGRLENDGYCGFFTINDTAHDETTLATIRRPFDGLIEIRRRDGGREVRVETDELDTDWIALR